MREFPIGSGPHVLRLHDLAGAGPAVVFVHGLGCASSCDFPCSAAEPALAARRRLLVDLPGFGFSDRPEEFGYTVEEQADVLAALLDALDLREAALVGHSMGGAVAIETATRRPGRVGRLVLAEPNLDAGGGAFSLPVARQEEAAYVAAGHAAAVSESVAAGFPTWAATARVASPFALHRAACSLVRGGTPSWREQLLALPLPRAVIFGARSLPDPDTGRLPAAGIPVHVVAGAGHAMMCDQPEGFARAVALALAS